MDKTMRAAAVLALFVMGGAAATVAAEPSSKPIQAFGGRGIAERNCGGCHALDSGPSPLADAPPFATLYLRYPSGGLEQILTEGMLAPQRKPEEGSAPRHPRMPMVELDDDEVAQLKAYLRGLEPPSRSRP